MNYHIFKNLIIHFNIKVHDARGKPPNDGYLNGNWGNLGSYSSCLEVNFTFLLESKHDFRGQYCLLRTYPNFGDSGSNNTENIQKVHN